MNVHTRINPTCKRISVDLMEISKSFLKKKLWSIGGPQKIFPKNFLKSDASGEEGGGGVWVSWKKLVFG